MSNAWIRRVDRHRAPCRGWRRAAVVVTASMLLVGCSSTPDDRGSTSGASGAPDAPATTASTSEAPTASSLEGRWRTRSISLRDTEATLRRQGFGEFIEGYHNNAPFTNDTVLSLSIEGGQWNLYGEAEGKPAAPIDYDASYEIDGDTVTFRHSNGINTHRWTVEGDTLSLEFVRGTLPSYEGIPDEVFQRALYMTEPFTRQG